VFERLPPSILLVVSVLEGDRRVLRADLPLQLEPGESRVLSLTVGGACTIDGLVLEADGSAAPDVDVWLIPRGGNAYLDWRQEQDVVARARSDARGRFTLPDVTPGTWRVGIAPEMPRARMPRTDVSRADGTPLVETPESYDLSPPEATRSPAPIASEIVVTAQLTHAEVTLTCWRGLYIRGRVIGMGSELVDGAFVTAKGGRLVTTVQSRLLGFSLGPLPPGSYQVGALRTVKPYGEAQPVTADAGTEDVVLQLVPQGPLWIAVLDSQGSPAGGAQVWFFPEGGANDWRTSTAPEDGRVGMLSGLGRLTIAASTAAGEYGWTSGVEVGRDGPAELELHLRPAARLRVVVPAALVGHVLARVRQDGRVVGLLLVDGRSVVVPAGELEVELFQSRSDSREAPERRSVHMVEGLETVVEFTAVTSAK
jgi:hypothetical protein